MTEKEKKLIGNLIRLASPEDPSRRDRGALAALRSGLGKQPGEAPRMFPLLSPYLEGEYGPGVATAFLTGALFGSHPEHAQEFRGVRLGSLGSSLWCATLRPQNPKGKHGEEGVEARLASALDADAEDLPRHLSGLVSLCASAGVPINWFGFLDDVKLLLSDWPDPDDPSRPARDIVRMRWARHFWRGTDSDSKPQDTPQ